MIILNFNKHFYTIQAVKSAIGAYSHLADFKLKEDNISITVSLKNIEHNFRNIIGDEFQNFVLAEMKNER